MPDTISHPAQRAFLAAYAELGNVSRAAAIAGISRETHYDWNAADPEYATAFEKAREIAGDALVDEARRRAVDGYEDYVVSKGAVVEYQGRAVMRRRYSDALLALLIKGSKKEYRDHGSIEVSGPGGKPIAVDLTALSDDELNILKSLARKTAQP